MAAATTLSRARRSMAEIARQLENPDVAQVLYPLMQVVDIAHLHADIAVGGGDQRKVHMIAREKLPLLGCQKPVCVHLPLLHGLNGGAKMSSTRGNFVAIDDPPEVIEKKIKDAFCPPKVVGDNPVLEYARYVVLTSAPLKVKRPQKYGGDLEVKSWNELRKLYEGGKIHPADLKPALVKSLVSILTPMRKYLEKHT
jgi:tyrosyl-tRNA synthetase